MKQASALAKGKKLEDWVANQIREKGLDPKAYRSHGSGSTNNEKGDIWTSMQCLGQNVGIECKNQKVLKIQEWWKQTLKLESLSREPVLVFKVDGEPMEATKCVIYLETFLELCARQGDRVEPEYEDPRQKYEVKNAIEALKKVLKHYE